MDKNNFIIKSMNRELSTRNGKYKIVPSSYLILIRDRDILLQRRYRTGYEDGNYGFIAGHVEEKETFLEALIREAKEESGLSLQAKDLDVAHVMHRRGPTDERVDVFIRARKWLGNPKIMEPDKCDEMGWFAIDALPDNVIPYIRQAIACIDKNIFYSEHGWR